MEHCLVALPTDRNTSPIASSIFTTVFFWSAFALACAILLPRYYVTRGTKRTNELRLISITLETLVLLTFVLPWIPASRGGPATGLQLIANGEWSLAILALTICAAMFLLLTTRKSSFLRAAAILHFLATPLVFAIMLRLTPGAVRIVSLVETAPFIAVLLLLSGDVLLLLLWHRLRAESEVGWTVRNALGTGAMILLILVAGWMFAPATFHQPTPGKEEPRNVPATNAPGISAAAAAQRVRQLPAVIGFLREVPGAIVEVDHEEDGTYVVHVFEVKDNHTATFNWYIVDRNTGKVQEMEP